MSRVPSIVLAGGEGKRLIPLTSDRAKPAVVRRAILDKNVIVAPHHTLGVDLERDRQRYACSAGGVLVVAKDERVGA